ncbi:MAG: hypothetical protein IIC13_09220 [SAR324 cluster bacterium]|nr:hypothetical protein [SAR324 cluster bacterium]
MIAVAPGGVKNPPSVHLNHAENEEASLHKILHYGQHGVVGQFEKIIKSTPRHAERSEASSCFFMIWGVLEEGTSLRSV